MLQAMVVVFGFMALGFFAQRREEQNRSSQAVEKVSAAIFHVNYFRKSPR
ncbi:hypothetical protein [uncultured Brevibacillus sp.]|nr:hypothetical protein [uncultured Brevibacillus sp.]